MKVLVTPRSFRRFDLLEQAGFEIVKNESGGILTAGRLGELIKDCDGVILGVDPLTSQVIEASPNLKAIAKYGVGIDNIDLPACEKRGIKVSRTVGANANAVADYAFALMLSVARKVLPIDTMCRQSNWSKTTSIDVFGKTLGLIGLGAIGKGVAARAKGFHMDVLAYDVFWDDSYALSAHIKKATPEQIYSQADFISVHVPLNDETRHMISDKQIGMMKPTAILINTARGGIIDEDALLRALQDNRIFGAGIDAFEKEPPENPAWFALRNIVMGSHCAASTTGATEQMGTMAVQNLIRDLALGDIK